MSSAKSLTTRFIYPFFYTQDSLEIARSALVNLTINEKPVWQPVEEIKDFYRQEMLVGLRQFVFGESQYFVVNPELANQWFGKGVTVSFDKESFNATLSTQVAIEVFLSPQGAGVLSIPLTAVDLENDAALKQFNYRLSQHLSAKIPQLSLPYKVHPNAPPPPTEDSPLSDRLGKRGGPFTLVELRDILLSPLDIKEIQEQFSVYSVIRFADSNFCDEATQAKLQPLLVGLAHVEEPHHAGSLEIPQKQLNTRHWSAVGTLGAVHFVADQAETVNFNQQRVPIVLNKYFLPYLVALLQRLILQRILQHAQQNSKQEKEAEMTADVQQLHDQMLHFMLNGYLSEVSSREVINQYYELAKQGLRVEQSFEVLRRALHDADLKEDMKFQRQSSDKSQAHLNQLVVMQRKIEWLEVFFASYYAGALAHYVGYGWFEHSFSSASTLWWAVFTGGLALFGLRPWQHGHSDKPRKFFTWTSLTLIVVAFCVWLAVGFYFFTGDSH